MICPMVPFPVILSDPYPRFQGHGVIFMPIDALNLLCAQLTRDLFAIAKLLLDKDNETFKGHPRSSTMSSFVRSPDFLRRLHSFSDTNT